MAQAVTSSSAPTGEKMASPSISLLPEKRSPTNGHSSPARTGKMTPSNTERKPLINGHSSPSHPTTNGNNNHAGKQLVEGYLKTDDRMRLAKERREERERSLAAREQLIKEKERRARLQYERTVEERWRRLEEQRQREELRRAAVEEKRRQQLEEERERLEALMKRSLERSLQLEQRNKRWSRGCATGAAPCSPHRSPFRGSLNPADHNRAGLQGGSQSTPNTPKKERLRRERRTASPGYGSPVRRSESPANVHKHLASPTTSKLASKMRAQSPSSGHQNHCSPTRHQLNLPSDDRKGDQSKAEATRRNPNLNSTHPTPQSEKNANSADTIKTRSAPDKCPKVETSEGNQSHEQKDKNLQDGDKKRESTQCTTGKVAAGTTNAEEATRLLAERRRQARAQKEMEEQKREQEEEKRLKEEQLKKHQQQLQRDLEIRRAKEREKNEEEERRMKQEEEDKRRREEQEKELQAQMSKEREKAKVQAQEDAERHRQDRELQTQHEEEERQLRKKRIEEIMKRTRKCDSDLKEEQVETKWVPPPGDVKIIKTKAQINEHVSTKGECQVQEQVTKDEGDVLKKEAASTEIAAAQTDVQKIKPEKNNTHLTTPTQSEEQSGLQQKEVEAGKQHRARVEATGQIKKEPAKTNVEEKANERVVVAMNGSVKGQERASMNRNVTAERKEAAQVEVVVTVTPLPVGHPAPPVIRLEPLDVKASGDEVQSMEVSPASKEELISIPEFSPVNEIHLGNMSNTRALEDLMDLTGSVTGPRLSSEGNVGDCNKNLIEGVVSPMSDSKIIGVTPPTSNTLSIQ